MCLTKVYYNTYSDGAQDITEKNHPCRDGRACSRPDVRRYDRKFPFTKLGDAQPESHRSLSERKPTPYFSGDTPRGSKSPSPSRRRDSGAYMSGANPSKHYDYGNPYGGSGGGGYDAYGYPSSSSRHDPYSRDAPRLKRSSTNPHIIYGDRERDRDRSHDRSSRSSRSRSNSASRAYSHDIPIGLVPLADEYGRRHRRHSHSHSHSPSSSSRSRERASHDGSDSYYPHRRRTDDPAGYTLVSDQDERRRQRRAADRRASYADPSSSSTMSGMGMGMGLSGTGYGYPAPPPRRASTVVHHADPGAGAGSSGRKQLRWEDQVRAKRDRQNAEIASRAASPWGSTSSSGDVVKGILKHGDGVGGSGGGKGKGKGREVDDRYGDIADLRRAVERMEIPRGRDREPRGGRGDEWGGGRWYEGGGGEGEGRRKRSTVWADGGYRY